MRPANAQDASPPADLRDYFLVLLVNPGPRWVEMSDDVFARHTAYVSANTRDGTYRVDALVTDGGRIRRAIIMEAKNLDAANAIVAKDPAVLAHVLAPDIHPMRARDLSALGPAPETPSSELRPYFLSLMTNPGPERIPMPDDVFARHMAYRNARTAAGVYKLGGPVTDGGPIRGATILEAESPEAARAIVEQDPAVQAGILKPEIRPVLTRDLSRRP